MMHRSLRPFCASALLFAPAPSGAQVELRGQREVIEGEIVSIGVDGVDVRGVGLIAWDRVRSVQGEYSGLFEREFRAYADDAWRARTRLARGDFVSAEPIFERLFATFAWRQGPTARGVCDGLLRCRLRRNAQASAISPWLSLLHSAGPRSGGMLDPNTGLIPSLPPFWLPGTATERFAVEIPSDAGAEPRLSELARWYELAAAFESGRSVELPGPGVEDRGLALVRAIVSARAGDERTRRLARDALRLRAESEQGTWVEAWCLAGIGRSLLREGDPRSVREGIVALLQVPARFERDLPFLAGLCLAEASAALHALLGDREGAARVAQELATRLPGHPALAWTPVRDLVSAGARSGAGGLSAGEERRREEDP